MMRNFSAAPLGRIVNCCSVTLVIAAGDEAFHWNDANAAEGPDGGGVDTAMLFPLTYGGRLA
jgi:hypothetical protein